MLATPHMVAGAAIARRVQRPLLALPLAFASHFVLDVVPHLDTHGMFGIDGGGPTHAEAAAAIFDFLLGTALVVWASRRQPRQSILLAGALLAISVDLVDNVPPWNAWFHALPGMLSFSAFHHGIQHNVDLNGWMLGFGTQLVVLAVSLGTLLSGRPARRERGLPCA